MNTEINFGLIKEYAYTAGLALAVVAFIYLILYFINYFSNKLKKRLLKLNLQSLNFFGLEIINVGKQRLIITTLVHIFQILISLVVLYFSLVFVLSEIPATEDIADQLMALIFNPLKAFVLSLMSYLPDLFNIIITVVIARYLIKFVQYVTKGVIAGNFNFPGFHPRTASTTGGIVTFLIYTLTIIIILPSMPGYESLAFKGIAAFLGALITIGGSSVIANYMAGMVLTYMHAFEKGDWVTVDNITGSVTSTGAFAVQLTSYKGEAINIPNSKVLSSAIKNYSGNNPKEMILHTEISIGYDVPWKKVNALLIEAAHRTAYLNNNNRSFVLQKKLDDFYIVYELNTFLNRPEMKPKALSALLSNILDVFNEAKIEILSPHYRAKRDGTPTTILSEELETDVKKD